MKPAERAKRKEAQWIRRAVETYSALGVVRHRLKHWDLGRQYDRFAETERRLHNKLRALMSNLINGEVLQ